MNNTVLGHSTTATGYRNKRSINHVIGCAVHPQWGRLQSAIAALEI